MLSIFFIGLALSMDAFSVSVSIGTTNINHQRRVFIAIIIGAMHVLMPQIGFLLGNKVFNILPINVAIFNVVIFIYLGITMLLKKDDGKEFKYSLLNAVVLAFCVSLDSFSVGLGLMAITDYIMISTLIFGIISTVISYIGLTLGQHFYERFKERANILGAIILFTLAVVNLIKEFL